VRHARRGPPRLIERPQVTPGGGTPGDHWEAAMIVTFEVKTDALSYADITVGYGKEWHHVDTDNGTGEHDFPDGVLRFVLQVQMEGEPGGSAAVTMTRADGAPVKPDFHRAVANDEGGQTLVTVQVEHL